MFFEYFFILCEHSSRPKYEYDTPLTDVNQYLPKPYTTTCLMDTWIQRDLPFIAFSNIYSLDRWLTNGTTSPKIRYKL